jgi:RND family efflux transporter MFP subunit
MVFIVFMLNSCLQKPGNEIPPPREIPRIEITTADVSRRDMVDTVWIYGEVKLRQEALLASQFDGRLDGFTLLMGDRVKKGQKLGVIIPPMREALLQVMDQMDENQKKLMSNEINEITMYSPIEGIILEVFKHTGDVVQKGEPIVHIGQLKTLDIHGDLPLSYLKGIQRIKYINVVFVNYHHDPLRLRIDAIGGQVDQAKQTVPLRLKLDNLRGEFRPGILTRLYFPGETHTNVLVIPRAALLEEEGVYSAFVLKADKTVEKRYLKTGIIQDDYVEVLSGLEEGEKVATKKAYSLIDGMEVTIK